MNTQTEETWEQETARERGEKKQKIVGQVNLLKAISKGMGWKTVREPDVDETWWSWLDVIPEGEGEAGVFMGLRNNADKLEIASHQPSRIISYVLDKVEINVSSTKGVDQIVADIKRRFLPGFKVFQEQVNKGVNDNDSYYAKIKKNMKELLGVDYKQGDGESISLHCLDGRNLGDVWGTCRVSSDNIKLSLNSLSIQQAKDILEIIKVKACG